jgi:hypothetical protein
MVIRDKSYNAAISYYDFGSSRYFMVAEHPVFE